ncbi:holin [Lactiplantibacillus paraxiangfangensis]|uniref:holin n=1 Tax=Lactiplantibacillus paraxiangfangensis TaxID=3076224 RepID=UPI0030C6FE39
MKKSTLKNPDGTLNGKLLAAFISLAIIAIQLLLSIFHIKFMGDWGTIILLIDIILTMLGMLGVVTNVQFVNLPSTDDEAKQITKIANEAVDDEKSTSISGTSSGTSTGSSLNDGSKHA